MGLQQTLVENLSKVRLQVMTVITQCQICKGFHIDGCPKRKKEI